MAWELKNGGLDRGGVEDLRRTAVKMEPLWRSGWWLVAGGEDRTPLEVGLQAGGEGATPVEVGDVAEDQDRSLRPGVWDQRPSAGDQSRRPATEQQVWKRATALMDWRLVTGRLAGEPEKPGKQETAETLPEVTAAAEELMTAAAQELRTAAAQQEQKIATTHQEQERTTGEDYNTKDCHSSGTGNCCSCSQVLK